MDLYIYAKSIWSISADISLALSSYPHQSAVLFAQEHGYLGQTGQNGAYSKAEDAQFLMYYQNFGDVKSKQELVEAIHGN